jgi:hypothetical protein
MTTSNTWTQALTSALKKEPFTDRLKRRCHEQEDLMLLFEHAPTLKKPLEMVSALGWYYPSPEELKSIILGEADPDIYPLSGRVRTQLPRIISLLQQRPETRRAVIQFASFEELQLDQDNVPSLLTAHFRIRSGELHCTVHARSIDLLIGLPANLYQVGALSEHVANTLKIPFTRLVFFIGSAHVFEDYKEHLERILRKA